MGNLLFASKNMFLGITQSRRDDMISLAYLIVFLMNGELTWLEDVDTEAADFFEHVKQI